MNNQLNRYFCAMLKFNLQSGLLFLLLLTFISCSNYNKVLKSNDYTLKKQTAIELYNKKDYQRAYPLFEELVAVTRGTANAEDMYFYYCYCNYYLDDLISAGYHFQQFAKTYPSSPKAEEASYMNAYCYYLGSPDFTLDQTNSIKAIQEMQLFINQYPNSTRIQECNDLIDKLRDKLEKKAFESAMLYYQMMDYKAASMSLKNMLADYPNSQFKEEAMFTVVKANYLLAENSVENKKMERYKSTLDDYNAFINKFAAGKYADQAKEVYDKALIKYTEYSK
jgi:outer membrane protein assembly factor BamD